MHTMPSRLVRVTPPLLCECKQEHGACLGDITPSAVFFSPRARPSFVPPSLRYSALFTQHPTTFTLTPCSDRQKTGQGSLPTAHEKTESPPAAQVPHIGRSARRVSHRAALTRPSPSTTPRQVTPSDIPLSVQAGLVHGKDHVTSRVLPWAEALLPAASHDEPLPTKQCKNLHVEQHRVQSEYLSQVLYNSLSIVAQGLSEAASVPALQLNRYAISSWHLGRLLLWARPPSSGP
jgi:hypothetical protein